MQYLLFILFFLGGAWIVFTSESFSYRILATIGALASLTVIAYRIEKGRATK